MRIDLHTHSTASDGTLTPTEVVTLAGEAGLDVLALTDHDSAAGWAEASSRARETGLTLVPGMEISTKYAGAGVHLLGYLLDPAYPPLDRELARILKGRDGRLTSVLARLRAAGVDITEDEVRRQVADAPAVGRPHIADAMVAKGIVADRSEAFREWLSGGRPGHVVRYATPTAEMIRLVTEAGGAAVVAHPWGRGSRRVLDAETLAELASAGLVGIEVEHQDHSAEDTRELCRIATDLGLVMTGSSDFHGDGKVDHELGCHLTAPDQLDRLLAAAADNAAVSGRAVPAVARP
ncbi:MAG: PHP domain-containing protein [Nocardioidaceae bacterium]